MQALVLIAAALLCICIVLPIVAFIRTNKIRNLEMRLAGVEAALLRLMRQGTAAPAAEAAPPPPPVEPVTAPDRPGGLSHQHMEVVIGQKWVGWIAVALIFCAAAFFLKYAFENRWIGELGRVALGIAVGLAFVAGGLERYRKGWRNLSQILTAGGIAILYLSVYGAFGYYHLVDQRSAFIFLAILVAAADLLALAYNARAVAVMALAGGFLVPILLSTGRDQYAVLFTYIGVLDLGMLGAVIARRWRWIGSLAYVGTQGLFWAWYAEHYHSEKRLAVLVFQAAIFLLFVLADLAPNLRRQAAGWEEWIRLAINPFVFYATCYFLLNGDHHAWMAALALAIALVYAALARASLALCPSDALHQRDRRMLLVTAGTALTFVTLAIPVQLESNWITIAWGLQAVALLWASSETSAPPLRVLSAIVFAMALLRFLFADTPWGYRAPFTPVLNRYFLGMLALAACLGCAAYLYRRMSGHLAFGLLAAGVFWLGSSVEAYSYFDAQAQAIARNPGPAEPGSPTGQEAYPTTAKQLRWGGQLSLSMLWSLYAGVMTAAGFRLQLRAWRVAGLALFGLTLVKVVFLDIPELRQFYRIIALLALGVVLLVVAWKYQRGLRREQAR
jgi:uncharacterized membrane protein